MLSAEAYHCANEQTFSCLQTIKLFLVFDFCFHTANQTGTTTITHTKNVRGSLSIYVNDGGRTFSVSNSFLLHINRLVSIVVLNFTIRMLVT